MKILVALHLIFLLAPNDASPTLSPNGSVYITNGGSLALTCETDQDVALVRWKRNNVTMIIVTNTKICSFSKYNTWDTYNYSMTCDRQRMFMIVRHRVNSSDDNSTWSCQMHLPNNTDLGTSTPVRVLMHVPVGSAQLLNDTTLTLTENQSAVLVCETDACRPSAAIYWMKDGRNITNSATSVTANNVGSDLFVSIGTLTYTGQRGDNRKILTCEAYNDFASTQTSRNLTVIIYYPPEDPPVIDGQANGSNVTVIENISQILICRIIGGNPLANLSWICLDHIGLLSTSGETVTSIIVLSVNRSAQDRRCTCRSSHQVDGNKDIFVSLQVYFAPEMSVKVTPSIVEVNSEVRIECSAHGEPSSYKFYDWIHKLGKNEVRRIKGIQANQSTLGIIFPSIAIVDMGTYICLADNGITGPDGGIVQSMEAQINVIGVPVVFVSDTAFIGETNMSASIRIPFYSNPLIIHLKFFKTWNNVPIANDTDTQIYHTEANISAIFYTTDVVLQGMEAVLHFKSLKESDFGQYTLVLYNNKGTATFIVRLKELAPPSPVEQFYFYKFLGQYMEFFFVPGFNGGYQQTFTIQFKPSGSLDESWKNTSINGLSEMDDTYRLSNGTFLVPVEKLQPGSYVFRMFSVNEKNIRTYSQEVSVYIEADPNTAANIGTSIAGIAGGIGGGVAVVILVTGVVIFLWRRHNHTNRAADGTQRNQINAKSVRHDASSGQDYEGLHINNTEASEYLQLNDITLKENRHANTRPPENDSYEKLHPYTNTDIQMYSSLKIPKLSKDSEKVYENTRIKTTDLTTEHQ